MWRVQSGADQWTSGPDWTDRSGGVWAGANRRACPADAIGRLQATTLIIEECSILQLKMQLTFPQRSHERAGPAIKTSSDPDWRGEGGGLLGLAFNSREGSTNFFEVSFEVLQLIPVRGVLPQNFNTFKMQSKALLGSQRTAEMTSACSNPTRCKAINFVSEFPL